jgi:Tfp pilus assembly protein PilO
MLSNTNTPTQQPSSRLLTDYYGVLFFSMVLVFVLSAVIVLMPMLDEVKATNASVRSTLVALDDETAYANSLETSIAAAQVISPDVLDKVDRALPRRQEIPGLLVLFERVSSRDDVQISNVSFSEPTTPATTTVSELSINMTVTAADYPHMKKFIRDLEASLRLLDVVGITVATQGESSAYALQLKTYVYREAQRPSGTPTQR